MRNLPENLKQNKEGIFELSENAQNDIKEIWFYISENSVNSADKLISELFRKFQLLAKNFELGKSRNEYFINLRSFPLKKYIIFYVPTENGIEIFRVIHSSRNIEGLFDEFFGDLESAETE